MHDTSESGPPALEPCRLQVLADELGAAEPAQLFLAKYLSLLPRRIQRITKGLLERDAAASMDAVLSLKITSAMVGALETEGHCHALEAMILKNQFDYAVQALPALQHSTDRCLAAQPTLTRAAHSAVAGHAGP